MKSPHSLQLCDYLCVGVRRGLQEEVRGLEIADDAGDVQWRPSVRVPRVHVRAALHESPHKPQVDLRLLLARDVEGQGMQRQIDLYGGVREEELHHVLGAAADGPEERRSELVVLVDVRAFCEQLLRCLP